jgi:putative phage-type endonuclease
MTVQQKVSPTGIRVLSADVDRETWLKERAKYLCSSDMAAVLGVTEYSTALHVFLSKRGEAPEDTAGEAALWGNLLEDVVAQEWCRRNRSVIRRIGLVRHQERTWQACTLDRVVKECPDGLGHCALEIKTRSAFLAGKWKRDIPDDVLAQVVWAMETCGYSHMHVAVLIGGQDYRQYVVKRDPQLAADIVAAGQRFWTEHVLSGIEPVVTGHGDALAELYDALHPSHEGVQRISDLDDQIDTLHWMREYELGRVMEKRGEKRKKDARAQLLRILGPADTAVVEDEEAFSYRSHSKEALNTKKLKEERPEIYDAYLSQSAVTTLRIAKKYTLRNDYQEEFDV